MKDIFVRKGNILAFSELAACQTSLKGWKHFKNETSILEIKLPKMKFEAPAKKYRSNNI
jgi:hypothetical protein